MTDSADDEPAVPVVDDGSTTIRQPRLGMNTAANLGGNIWSIALGIGATPLLLIGLGRSGFGVWAILQTFSATTGWFSLADLGVGTALARETAARRAAGDDQADRLAATGLTVLTGLAAVFGTVFVILGVVVIPRAFNVPADLRTATQFAVVATGVQVVVDLFGRGQQAVLEGRGRLDLARISDIFRRTGSVGGAAITAMVTGDLGLTMAAAAAGSIVGLTISLRVFGRVPVGPRQFNRDDARMLMRSTRSFAALNGVGVLHRAIDRVVIGVVLGPAAVALVEIASQVQMGVTAVLNASTYPAMSSAPFVMVQNGVAGARDLAIRVTRWSVIATAPIVGVIAVLAVPLLDLWVDIDDPELHTIVWLAIAYPATTMVTAATNYVLQGLGHTPRLVGAAVVAVGVNLVASIVLVNRWGIEGVYVASLCSIAIVSLNALRVSRTEMELQLAPLVRRGVVPGVTVALLASGAAAVGLLLPTAITQVMVGGVLGGSAIVASVIVLVGHQGRHAMILRLRTARTRTS